jgi:hypothetical protein
MVMVIVTDGGENSSKEFNNKKIKEMIDHQAKVYKWQFTFLGANQDSFAVAANLGIAAESTSNYSEEKTSGAFLGAHSNVARMRGSSAKGHQVTNSYSAEERKAMSGS